MGKIIDENKERLDKYFKGKINRITNELTKKFVFSFLSENISFLPLYYTEFNENYDCEICFMYYLGEINGRILFYFERDKVICEKYLENQVRIYEINNEDKIAITKILDKKKASGERNNEVVVPYGIFAFRHKYAFATSASDGEESVFM